MEVIQGNIVNIFDDSIHWGEIIVEGKRIFTIKILGEEKPDDSYLLPGFVDAHVHIESSMLTPAVFGNMALVHGTVASVSDPHEIANVLGEKGVEYMIEDANQSPFKVCFGAPSCVPATGFETAGATIDSRGVERLLRKPEIGYLAEMMNFPGVIYKEEEVMAKLAIAKSLGKVIDGHAPGLRGADAETYFSAGISTDHECFSFAEAEEKLKLGVKVLIREGSAAKNFEALIPLAKNWAHQMMFCSDDKHPDDLIKGHINVLVARALEAGVALFDALRMASLNPVKHYGLEVGLLQEGDPADFIRVKNLQEFQVLETYVEGKLVAKEGRSLLAAPRSKVVNNFNTRELTTEAVQVQMDDRLGKVRVIKVNDGQLMTDSFEISPRMSGNTLVSDTDQDILKLVVYNRYQDEEPAVGFIHGFGMKEGAIASSVAHDSHNIIAVGVNDVDIVEAINLIVREKGGVSAVSAEKMGVLPLPVAGLMSDKDAHTVAKDYEQIDAFAKLELGSKLISPYMSLSFMALLVIPALKLSDKGLFDGNSFKFVDLKV
ncbi:adenine deaminase [Marinilongibacter aquaticus]|uniref:adenine deaminase n=1 Tax=Marinilongibacter aquaticus TaxID=2975157 RepID=UPI0021BD5913|nr:adenine deaminase [Marinilongibacter aquaticus]UBM60646.1 adenine deaminase [Marinilongibacter aquaticus]